MKSLQMPPTIEPSAVRVLSVSPVEEDHVEIERILDKSARVTPTGTCWQLSLSRTLPSALTAARQAEFAVIVCESSLGPGSWKDLMEDTPRHAGHDEFISVHRDEPACGRPPLGRSAQPWSVRCRGQALLSSRTNTCSEFGLYALAAAGTRL
jgi:hypothetical protein